MFYIYCICNNVNDKKYIGKAKNPKNRWSQHKSALKHKKLKNSALYSAMRKYGIENFYMEVLKEIESEPEAYELEKLYIKEMRTHVSKNGYNIGLGGEGNKEKVFSEEWKRKLGIASKRRYNPETAARLRAAKATPEAKLNSSLSVRGSKNARSKLTEEIVLEIRRLAATKQYKQTQLAVMFNTPPVTINHIIKRYSWKHI